MSVYSVKKKGWRYDFTLEGKRYTVAWFKTMKEAKQAEAKKRQELKSPPQKVEMATGMGFLELLNERLDFIREYKTKSYYDDNRYLFKRLAERWNGMMVCDISTEMVQMYILERAKDSHFAANYDIRLMKALFNLAISKKAISENPVVNVPFLPVEKKRKYVPTPVDIDKVIAAADPDTQDYLWTIRETMGRMSEINRLTWDDVDLQARYVTLYTRKKSGGHLTPRRVPMTQKLGEVLEHRFRHRNTEKPWVFWHRYWCRKTHQWMEGPYQDRKQIMRSLCRKAGVRYFRFHAMRHAGASILDNANTPITAIQEILGHENRTTTEIYLHSVSGAAQQAMAAYELARRNSHTDSHTK